jgi:hypothetical protein
MQQAIFLPDVNNEREVKSQQYRNNLLSLEKLVLFRFAEDQMGERAGWGSGELRERPGASKLMFRV